MGFGKTEQAAAKEMITYNVTVKKVRPTKNDNLVFFDMTVNGIEIRECKCVEYKNSKGETGYIIDFPGRPVMDGDKIKKDSNGKDMYSTFCFFPISRELRLAIVDQIGKVLAGGEQK